MTSTSDLSGNFEIAAGSNEETGSAHVVDISLTCVHPGKDSLPSSGALLTPFPEAFAVRQHGMLG